MHLLLIEKRVPRAADTILTEGPTDGVKYVAWKKTKEKFQSNEIALPVLVWSDKLTACKWRLEHNLTATLSSYLECKGCDCDCRKPNCHSLMSIKSFKQGPLSEKWAV